MLGQMVSFDCRGDKLGGYLARPSKGSGIGLVLLQEWWGLVGHIKDVADRMAAEGFTVLAPDLYKGRSTSEPDEAGSLMMALNIAATEQELRCAVDAVLADSACSSAMAGVVGFCMGGQLSLLAATINPRIGACVNYYGIHPNVKPNLAQLHGPVLGFFADRDPYATPAAVAALDAELTSLGKSHEFHTFANTDHAFFNSDRPEVYDQEAAEASWRIMVEFLKRELG